MYPVLLLGLVGGMALGAALAHHDGVAADSMSGVLWVGGGVLVGVIPGVVLAYRGSKAYQRALDEHYEGTRWARRSSR
jgi:hypothetical protein